MAFNGWVPRDDGTGLDEWDNGTLIGGRDYTPDELDAIAQAEVDGAARDAQLAAWDGCRGDLRAALALLPSMPLPDPAEQDAATAQVNASLEAYRAIDAPPADVVDLANKVSTHLQSNGYIRMQEARAGYRAPDAAFLADPTVTLPQLIAQVRALTAQLAMVRDA